MKRILSAFIEASMFIACIVWAYRQMPEIFESVQRLCVIEIITALAIFAAKAMEVFIIDKVCYGYNIPVREAINMVSLSVVFFVAYLAMEYFGDMPVSNRLLITLSIGSALSHMFISHALDTCIGLNRTQILDMVHPRYEDYEDDEVCDKES